MHCSDEAITAARQRMRDVERHVVTHGIRDVAKFDRHVVELVASHFDGGPPQEPFRSELIDWGLYMIRTDEDVLRRDLQSKA